MIEETLQTFAEQDVPPSRLQAQDVLAAARRRTRRRTGLAVTAAGGATALALLGVAVAVRAGTGTREPAGTGPDCVLVRLAVPASVTGVLLVVGVDPSGRYVIGTNGAGLAARLAVRWDRGVPAVLSPAFTPKAVNAAGTVVGFTGSDAHSAVRQQRPVAYQRGALVTLPLPAGAVGGAAYSVNARGDVLGTGYRADGSSMAVLWRANGQGATATALAGDAFGRAVTDSGVAVGYGQGPDPVRWTGDGRAVALPLPADVQGATVVAAAGDWAVGVADVARADAKGDPPPDLQVSLRWNLRTGAVERIPGIVARAVSASGRIAGVASTGAAAYWQSGRLFTLPGTAYAALAGVTADGHTFAGDAATGTGPVRSDGSQAPGNAVPAVWRGC